MLLSVEHCLTFLVLALPAQHRGQVVHARQCVRILEAQHLLAQLQLLLVHPLHLLVLALAAHHHSTKAHTRRQQWIFLR
jgi:hypothetical protein